MLIDHLHPGQCFGARLTQTVASRIWLVSKSAVKQWLILVVWRVFEVAHFNESAEFGKPRALKFCLHLQFVLVEHGRQNVGQYKNEKKKPADPQLEDLPPGTAWSGLGERLWQVSCRKQPISTWQSASVNLTCPLKRGQQNQCGA